MIEDLNRALENKYKILIIISKTPFLKKIKFKVLSNLRATINHWYNSKFKVIKRKFWLKKTIRNAINQKKYLWIIYK